mmetsp:Transcript_62201/g.86482  ORF Transcript_62201/g.86482 Transcript_62201/m.86482 type:complete len:628 (-) Transcript_62201:1876-3759(-)
MDNKAGAGPNQAGHDEPVSITVPVADTTVTDVTVYVDRAEVTRVVEIKPERVGPHAIVIKGLTDSADTNSIRVQGGGGVAATILEVSFATTYRAEDTTERADKVSKLEATAKAARLEVNKIRAAVQRIEQQDKFLAGFVDTALGVGKTGDTKEAAQTQLVNDLTKVQDVFDFFEKKSASIDECKRGLQQQREQAEVVARAAEHELAKHKSQSSDKPSNDVTVQLATETEANGKTLILRVSYMVRGASWLPSYDLRASVEPPSIQLTYYGMVRQSTGEDWINARVSLSTAAPASAGTPPAPPTKIVQWKRTEVHNQQQRLHRKAVPMQSRMRAMNMIPQQAAIAFDESDGELSVECDEIAYGGAPEAVIAATAGVKSAGTGTATFMIEHPSTIESDSKEHKVTITVMELEPNFEYFCTPALSDKAYLQARVVNTSEFPFLESDRGNIFLDGSFVTSTFIKAASPGENFSIFLGVDPSIKIEHRQVKKSASEGTKGSTFKSATDSTETHEYTTLVTNTKPKEAIKITIVQIFPRASDDKIVVDLLSPSKKLVKIQGEAAGDDDVSAKKDVSPTKKDVANSAAQFKISQNKVTNNLVFFGEIEPQGKRKIDYSYVVTWPVTAGTGKIEIV